jgi:cyclopropane fatty-acyl-phospholipid synthase-like methyltransferase
MAFIADLASRPIAIEQEKANEQHYEVPTEFIQMCLGPRMKYSSCLFSTPKSTLAEAEETILASYCVDAKLGRGLRNVGVPEGKSADDYGIAGKEGEGLRILDLGCGWGSLGLYLAEVSDPNDVSGYGTALRGSLTAKSRFSYSSATADRVALSVRRDHHVVQLAHTKGPYRQYGQGEGLW